MFYLWTPMTQLRLLILLCNRFQYHFVEFILLVFFWRLVLLVVNFLWVENWSSEQKMLNRLAFHGKNYLWSFNDSQSINTLEINAPGNENENGNLHQLEFNWNDIWIFEMLELLSNKQLKNWNNETNSKTIKRSKKRKRRVEASKINKLQRREHSICCTKAIIISPTKLIRHIHHESPVFVSVNPKHFSPSFAEFFFWCRCFFHYYLHMHAYMHTKWKKGNVQFLVFHFDQFQPIKFN